MTAVATKGVLKWGHKKYLKTDQHAWHDSSYYEVPFTGHPTAEDVQRALDTKMPRQSSYGVMRWHSGFTVESVDYDRSVAIVVQITSITD